MNKAITNRIHRSGAIDYNVEFATRQAEINQSEKGDDNKKRLWSLRDLGPGKDALSVCEGEPLYTTKKSRSNTYSAPDSCRNPISCLSSLNGTADPNFNKPGQTFEEKFCSIKDIPDTAERIKVYEELRDMFFAQLTYSGIAVSKWAYERQGRQQDQFVATMGGLNTIYVDEDVHAGDTVCIDLPFPDNLPDEMRECRDDKGGFVHWVVKKGVPETKRTLVVRPLPGPRACCSKEEAMAMLDLQKGFERRRQKIGVCVTGAKKGERCDIVLAANAIGMFTYSSNNNPTEER